MKKTLILNFTFLIFTISYAKACDCMTPPFAYALEKYEAIFIGKLIKNYDTSDLYTKARLGWDTKIKYHNFEVISYYKGLSKENNIISIIDEGTNCDVHFSNYAIGDTFIVYAYYLNPDGNQKFLSTNACTGTKLTKYVTDKGETYFINCSKAAGNFEWKKPKEIKTTSLKIDPKGRPFSENKREYLLVIIIAVSVISNFMLGLFLFRKK